ncbi:ribosomal protein S18-alanine N-acetyltransferase [Actinobacillus pleuropneumoniae]|uniref:[Ribosomal protein bS18]-alanine N-acetyltransferase n=1 Tax=Actinobacillus pleuropneumoniae TaxID=715 RepID=A0A9Q4DJJ5_ACTPL|nr:ribosomal protein S18-alanine N-acetyltransferase [Actinobacillus pleuropneumoniae]MCL7721364.1 ribosomal protein S18-alanine N-acetyltransferase [Actinobacillus pleuropneumoniae]MCL7727404.1 ribosomal protein S18-alanine N-acetyltransferase [Actinobacillus pleuropneumoniae]MCL7728723.1 ribosomal protein S18-alanine N-acetyltransferase [Actinobacillus pleuropneumoniae]MCY6368949.1 ribosomal protein S18-alanine N-acetyltransferase [Actinobacillus pleuropneumoniae]MCY6385823.1 ribosomal prote
MIEIINESDFDRLFEIEQAAHLVPWSKGTLLNNQGDKYLNLKLTEQDQIVAFAICQTVLDEATLFNIAVDPNFQAKGYGKRLLPALIERLREQGILTLWLEVRESNLAAQKLYDSLGFNEVTIRKNYYPTPSGERENAIVMALYL